MNTNNKTVKDLLIAWKKTIELEEKFKNLNFDWQDSSEAFKEVGIVAIRNNKDNPYTIDMLTNDGTIYTGCYIKSADDLINVSDIIKEN